jgi:HD-GYP domain-containing protein (c-di-GMP phosphodiesterase class II)
MKKIPVNLLKPGLAFSEPVYIEDNSLLVPAGVAIREKDLEQLSSWGVDSVETDGKPILSALFAETNAEDGLADTAEPPRKASSVISLPEVQENKGAYRAYIELIDQLELVFIKIGSGLPLEAQAVDSITGKLLQAVREQRNSFIGFILGGEVTGREMAKSSVNTAILSAFIALELKLPHHKMMQVVTGALLHDAGMLRLPKEIVHKKGGLSAEELQRIQAHPVYTYRIVSKELLYPNEVGLVVLQHHERWDGQGYPRRTAGAAIDLGARIVSVADAFEAMVSQKSYRNSMIGYQAMKNLLSDNSRRFDPDVLKAFIQIMGIYPIGSIVLLNNGALARVEEVKGTVPLRPKIRILIDEGGTIFQQDEGDVIDLLIEKSLFIARAIDPKEVAKKT